METALDVSTFHLRQLMLLFHVDSNNFYGDIAQVKVAMRRDSSPQETRRLRHLAHQVTTDLAIILEELTFDLNLTFSLYVPFVKVRLRSKVSSSKFYGLMLMLLNLFLVINFNRIFKKIEI